MSELFRNVLCLGLAPVGKPGPPSSHQEGTRAWGVWGGRRAPPTAFLKDDLPHSGQLCKEHFYQVTEGCQSPQNQAQKRGCLIIYASIGAYEDQFTLSRSDQYIRWERLVAQSNARH